jgi:DNA-binding MarR family transcriptional regulator
MDDIARQAAMADLCAQPGHLLWRATARVTRLLPGDVDLHAYAALVALADHEPQSQRSLASSTGVSGTTLTSVAQTLQASGFVERVRNPDDRRCYSLTRTPAGRSAVRRWKPQVERLEQQLTSDLTLTEESRLRALLLAVAGDDLDERTPSALLESTGFLVAKAHQRMHREFAALLQPLGIEPRHFGTLRALRIVRPATQGDLAVLLDVSPPTVVQLVDHLEQRGLVTRERDASDRRAYHLELRDEAGPVVERAAGFMDELLDQRLDGDRLELARLLRQLLTATEAISPGPRMQAKLPAARRS